MPTNQVPEHGGLEVVIAGAVTGVLVVAGGDAVAGKHHRRDLIRERSVANCTYHDSERKITTQSSLGTCEVLLLSICLFKTSNFKNNIM